MTFSDPRSHSEPLLILNHLFLLDRLINYTIYFFVAPIVFQKRTEDCLSWFAGFWMVFSLGQGSSSVSYGYNAPSVKRIAVKSPKVISVAIGGLTIKKAYDRICLEDFRQTCFGRVVGVWGRRGSIAFLIFYGSKFNVGWFGCHPGCNELRKYNRVLQLSNMSKNCINAFKKQNSDNA